MIESISAVTLATYLTDPDGHELSFAWPVDDCNASG
jgi:hypothetical protein